MSNNSDNNNGFLFWAGIAAGVALGFYLNSEQGREYRRQAATKVNEYGDQISTTAKEQWSVANEKAKGALESGKSYAADLSDRVKSKIGDVQQYAKETATEVKSAYERGTDKAKATLASKEAKLNNIAE